MTTREVLTAVARWIAEEKTRCSCDDYCRKEGRANAFAGLYGGQSFVGKLLVKLAEPT